MGPELTSSERAILEMLRSNHPEAVVRLAALDDVASARVLAHFAAEAAVSDGEAAVSDGEAAVSDGEAAVSDGEAAVSDGEAAVSDGEAASSEVSVGSGSGTSVSGFVRGLSRRSLRIVFAVLGLAALVVVFLLQDRDTIEAPSESEVLLLVRERAGDLYVGEAGEPLSRENRLVPGFSFLSAFHLTRDQEWFDANMVTVGDHTIVVAITEDEGGAWVASGLERSEFISESGTVDISVLDSTLLLREVREDTQRCYRGAVADIANLERVFRGDFCQIAGSGHVMGVDKSGDSHSVTVWSPEGAETGVVGTKFQNLPELAENGSVLVSTGDQFVTVTSVETGDRIWRLDEGVGFEMASHPGGNVAIAATAASGEVVLVIVGSDGLVAEIGEIHSGSLNTVFTASGYLYWTEEAVDGNAVLFVWNPDNIEGQPIVEVAEDDGLRMVGSVDDSIVTVIEDDIGAVFELFTLQGEGSTIIEFDDQLVQSLIDDDYLYVVGLQTVSVVSLEAGTGVVSEEWDSIEGLYGSEGTLVAVGQDRSSKVLISIGIGHEEGKAVEYGEY